jgi:hypothetical protein
MAVIVAGVISALRKIQIAKRADRREVERTHVHRARNQFRFVGNDNLLGYPSYSAGNRLLGQGVLPKPEGCPG